MACKYADTDLTVEQQQQEMVLVIGENIKVRRFARFDKNICVPYIHAGGKIAVLVNLETSLPAEAVNEVAKMWLCDRRAQSPFLGQDPGHPGCAG